MPVQDYPTVFPVDAARAVADAIASRTFNLSLVEPIWDLIGYALGQIKDVLPGPAPTPFPRPVVNDAPDLSHDQVADVLHAACQPDEPGVVRGPVKLPWGAILKVLAKILAESLGAASAPVQ